LLAFWGAILNAQLLDHVRRASDFY